MQKNRAINVHKFYATVFRKKTNYNFCFAVYLKPS